MFRKNRAFSSAVFTLISIDQSKIKFKEKILLYFIVHQFEEEISLFFKNYEENRQVALDIKALIKYERKSHFLFRLIGENTNNFIKLWTYYKKQDVALAQFVKKSNQIEKAADKIQKIMKGDLCSIVILPYFPSSICYRIADQIGAEGLIRMISFLVQGHIDVISTFEQSNRTAAAAFVAFNATNKVLSEQLSAFPLQAYVMIQDLLKSQLKQSVIDHENKVITIIIVYVIIYAILGWILSVKVWQSIKQERRSWRKIMRQIPCPIVATYKPLKTHLIKNCDRF